MTQRKIRLPENFVLLLHVDAPQEFHIRELEIDFFPETGEKLILLKQTGKIIIANPVVITKTEKAFGKFTVAINYQFSFEKAKNLMRLGASVRRPHWSWQTDIKSGLKRTKKDTRGPYWINTRDGYIPWKPSPEEIAAKNWGVKHGYATRDF